MAQDTSRITTLSNFLIPTQDDISRLEYYKLTEVPGGFVNLTPYDVSSQMSAILSFGPRFLLPQKESVIDYLDDFGQLHSYLQYKYGYLDTTHVFLELFNNHHEELEELFSKRTLSFVEVSLLAASREVIAFFRLHRDVVIVQSDKGNKTCLMLKNEYHLKMGAYVNRCVSKGIYVLATPNATDVAFKAFDQLRHDIVRALSMKQGDIAIPEPLIQGLMSFRRTTITLPRLYGTVKCHKADAPMRPICSTIKWPSRAVQKLLLHLLKECFSKSLCPQNVSNIDLLPKEISALPVRKGFVLVKMDVTDMYGTMNKHKIAKMLHHLLNHPSVSARLPISTGLMERLFHYSMETSCLIVYESVVYKQVRGLPQGACDSGFLATLYLDTLLQVHREALFAVHHVHQWWKYMDDILLYLPHKYVESFQKAFEQIFELKLEVEYEEDAWDCPLAVYGVHKQLSYLDLLINLMPNGKYLVSRYTKPTSSRRMIHALSTTIMSYKTNAIRGYIEKILKRTATIFLVYDLNNFYEQALSNGYPPMLLDHIYNEVLHKELEAIHKHSSFYKASRFDMDERYHVLETMLPDFPIGGAEVVQEIRDNYVASSLTRNVFPYRSVTFSRLIQLGCSYSGIGLPVYSRVDQSGAFSKFFAKQSIRRIVDGIETSKTVFHVGFVTCSTCGMIFILSGRQRLDALYESEMSSINSPLSQHQTSFGHCISPVVRRLRAVKGVDASYLSSIYAALFSSVGVSCSNPAILSQVPMFIRGLLGYMHGLGDFPSTDSVSLSPSIEAIFNVELSASDEATFSHIAQDMETSLVNLADPLQISEVYSEGADFGEGTTAAQEVGGEVTEIIGHISAERAAVSVGDNVDQNLSLADGDFPDVEHLISTSVIRALFPSSGGGSGVDVSTISVADCADSTPGSPMNTSVTPNNTVASSSVDLDSSSLRVDQSMRSDDSL